MHAMGFLLAALLGAEGFRSWGDAAFEEAGRDGKPVLLLVGDGACDGCSEAFADAELAAVVSRRFVPVAVDRLERPDIADLYRTASSLLPDAVDLPSRPVLYLLTPEQRPFAAAPFESAGLQAFLERRASEFQEKRAEVETKAGAVIAGLRESQAGEPARGALGEAVVTHALEGLLGSMDPVRGGFRTTPKAPPHGALRFLVEERERVGSDAALRLLRATLDGMARGGIHDPGAGFFSEGAAEDWGSPRPQKRLADNALLLRAYAAGHGLTGEARYRTLADEIADFCLGELREPEGDFAAGLALTGESGWRRDDRVIAGWNGLMISALAASGRKADLEAASRAASAVLQRLGPATLLRRLGRGSELGGAAFLEDHAYLAEGLLDLAEATGEGRWTEEAAGLVAAATARFLDAERGGFFDTDERHGPLPARIRNGYDGALPSANGVMASVLLRLARATGESRDAALGRRTVEAFLGDLQRAPRGMETLAAAAGGLLGKGEGPARSEAPLPSRVTRGSVTLEGTLSAARARPGAALEARIRLTIAEGHSVNPRAPVKDLVGLSVSVPGEDFVASPPRYPEPARIQRGGVPAPAYVGSVTVTVPLRVRAGRDPGPARVRLRVGFQACDAAECGAPESALLEIPLTLTALGP